MHGNTEPIVIKASFSEQREIRFSHRTKREGQLDCVITEQAICVGEIRPKIVKDQLLSSFAISRRPTELGRMGERSAVAIIDVADHGSQHLTTRLREAIR